MDDFVPVRRYTAVAMFSEDLQRVVMIQKLRPEFQRGKANFFGGKVDREDWPLVGLGIPSQIMAANLDMDFDHWAVHTPDGEKATAKAYLTCAARETKEETGVVVDPKDLKKFCTLRTDGGDLREILFYCFVGDVDQVRTMEAEKVFIALVLEAMTGKVEWIWEAGGSTTRPGQGLIYTMHNIPWLLGMALQCLRGSAAPPFVVYESQVGHP